MILPRQLLGDFSHVSHTLPGAAVPLTGAILSQALSLVSIATLAVCTSRRWPGGKISNVPFIRWLLLCTYGMSFLFIFASAVIETAGYNRFKNICGAGVFLCLGSYMMSKIFIYMFMVERVRLVHCVRTPRLRDPLYIFNSFFMLTIFTVIGLLNFVYRISFIDTNGICHLGMQRKALLPLLIFDSGVNIYLTVLFILPLTKLHTFNQSTLNQRSSKLRALTIRTIIGSILTLLSTAANAASLAIGEGQAAWICMATCNSDVLFCTLVLHFITRHENPDGQTGETSGFALGKRSPSRNDHIATASVITVTRSVNVDHVQSAPGTSDSKSMGADTQVLVEERKSDF